jgi:membrane protein YqaA with SNARE-associated domain
VQALGGLGIGIGYFLPDAFTLPIPNDAFALVGRVGGMSFEAVVAWGTAGSIVGGSVGWGIGKYLVGRIGRLQRYFNRVGARMMERFQRGGAWILFAAALTPLPYSVACWAAGAIGMSYTRFVLISLVRVFRVAGYLWVLEQGLGPLGP